MAKRFEPKVTFKRIDSSVSATINTTRARTYVGIEAKTGPYTLQSISSTKELVSKFSTKSKPSKSDGVTMLHAGKITQGFNVDVLRVNKDKIHPGVDSVGNSLFFDEKYNLIKKMTKIGITPSTKNLETQALTLVVDGVLYYNTNASTDLQGASQSYFEYQNNSGTQSWTEVSGHRAAIINLWQGEKKLITSNDTDGFLDEVHEKYLKSDIRFISYSNNLNRIILLSGYPESPYNSKLVDYLVQFDSNFLANKSLDYSRDLIELNNNGIIAEVASGVASLHFASSSVSANRLFKSYSSETSANNQIVYNGDQYYSLASEPSKITGVGTQLIRGVADKNYRDGLLGAITAIYNSENKLPATNIKQSVVIKSKPGTIFVYKNDGDTMTSEVKGDLKEFIDLELISYNESSPTVDAWIPIEDYTEPETVSAAWNNYLRITFKGAVEKVKNAAINLVTCTANGSDKTYNLYSLTIGNIATSDAITKDLTEYTDMDPINAIVPNLVAQYDVIGEEVLPEYNGTTSDTRYQKNCYYASNVDFIIMSTPYSFAWTGYIDATGSSCISKNTNIANLISVFYPQSQNMDLSENDGVNYVMIDNVIYYNYSTPSLSGNAYTYYKVSASKMTAAKFIEELTPILYNQLNLAMDNEGFFIINGEYSEPEVTYHNTDLSVDWTNVSQTSEAKFAIVQKFTSSAALSQFRLTIDQDDSEIIIIDDVHGTESHTDTISFNPDKINGYGVNIYYDKFNRLDRAFNITELTKDEGVIVNFESEVFGDEILPKVATIQDYINALDTLRNIGYEPSFLFDAGLSNIQYYKSLATFADEVQAMVPAAVPAGLSYDEARTWKEALGYSTERIVLRKWQRDVCFGDISFECSPAYYYLQKVLSNTNSVSREFEPIFGETQGRIETSDPVTENDTIDERENLLDMNINSYIRNNEEGFTYLNLNYTDQSYESDFSEEQNVRINNKIAHIATPYVRRNCIAKNNSIKLWDDTTNQLTKGIQSEVVDNRGDNTIRGFRVVCDNTNNNLELRRLTVDIYVTYSHSINEVLVYSRTENLEG